MLSSEKSALEVIMARHHREDRRMGYILVGVLVAIGLASLCIPGVDGLEFCKILILPAITGVLGYNLSSKRAEP